MSSLATVVLPYSCRKPHTKYMGPDPHTKSMTRHFLLESFVWEEAIRVKFLTGLAREREVKGALPWRTTLAS